VAEPVRTDPIQGDIIHVYDGIEEADNRLPSWWLTTFYVTIGFAAAYWFVFHMFELGDHPLPAYVAAQMEAMDRGGPVTDDELVALAADPRMVAAGGKAYAASCASCHGGGGEGKIGPNLTDEFWLHGGSPSAIYATIAAGVDGKGMPAWKPSLGGGAVKQLTAYVLSLRGTDRPGKGPEGERWAPPAAPADEPPAGPATAQLGG
jgi:cytochrome c oxidase cbb3-type subunit III